MDLTRSFSADQFGRALESWDRAGIQDKRPLFTSPFGDVFFQAPDGFWFLDLLEGTLTRPWPDADALQAELNTPEGQDRYLMAGLAFAAERQGIVPSATQVLSFKVAPVLGAACRRVSPAASLLSKHGGQAASGGGRRHGGAWPRRHRRPRNRPWPRRRSQPVSRR